VLPLPIAVPRESTYRQSDPAFLICCIIRFAFQHQYTQQVDFAQLKSELQLIEKNDLASLKSDNDRLVADMQKLKQRLREEITRTQAGVRLDLNLEKGRMRDESSGQELKIKEVDTRIEQEIANLRTTIQQSKVCSELFGEAWITEPLGI
jgi:hypothetical protein